MQKSKILELLRTANINNHQLEIALGLSNGCINKWTTGSQRPNIDALVKIADYFGVTVDYLLGRETDIASNNYAHNTTPQDPLVVDRILSLMAEKNLTCYRVAKDCHFDQTVFTQWKKGRQQPSRDLLIKLAKYFNVSLDDLLSDDTAVTITPANGAQGDNAPADATTAPLLQIWAKLDEVQRTKALAYIEGLQSATPPKSPTPIEVAIDQSRTQARRQAKEDVIMQRIKKDI